jgi:hypothetical protein
VKLDEVKGKTHTLNAPLRHIINSGSVNVNTQFHGTWVSGVPLGPTAAAQHILGVAIEGIHPCGRNELKLVLPVVFRCLLGLRAVRRSLSAQFGKQWRNRQFSMVCETPGSIVMPCLSLSQGGECAAQPQYII